jgi:hypothetical protein
MKNIHTHSHTHTHRVANDEGPDTFTLEDDFDLMTPHGLDYRHVTGITLVSVVSHLYVCVCARVHVCARARVTGVAFVCVCVRERQSARARASALVGVWREREWVLDELRCVGRAALRCDACLIGCFYDCVLGRLCSL